MSTPFIIQGTSAQLVAYLAADGVPVTGLSDTDVTAGVKKEGGVFVSLPLTPSNFAELGDGFYQVTVSSSETDVLGNLYVSLTGSGFTTALIVAFVAEAGNVPSGPATPPTTTDVYGYIYDSLGSPVADVVVSARTTSRPTLLHPGDDGIVISAGLVTATTDSAGFFSLQLITGTTVEVLIPTANYRRTITVPATTVNLFDLP